MASTFYLIRHGSYALLDDALGGRADYMLNEIGEGDANRVAAFLAGRPLATVVSSPVMRARQTAEIICEELRTPFTVDNAFAEIDFAGWTGKRFADLADDPAWQTWNSARGSASVPGGESMRAVQVRAVQRLVALADEFPAAEIAVVSHGDVIKSVLAHILAMPLDLLGRLDIAAGSISVVTLSDGDARVTGLNLRP